MTNLYKAMNDPAIKHGGFQQRSLWIRILSGGVLCFWKAGRGLGWWTVASSPWQIESYVCRMCSWGDEWWQAPAVWWLWWQLPHLLLVASFAWDSQGCLAVSKVCHGGKDFPAPIYVCLIGCPCLPSSGLTESSLLAQPQSYVLGPWGWLQAGQSFGRKKRRAFSLCSLEALTTWGVEVHN